MFPEYEILAELPYWWLDAFATSAFIALGLAFLTYGTGFALDGDQPRFGCFWRAMKALAIHGGIAYFLLSLPSFALSNYSDWVLSHDSIGNGTRLLAYAATSLVDTIFMVLSIALSVAVFLKADASRTD